MTYTLNHEDAHGTFDRTRHRRHLRARHAAARLPAAKGYREVIVTGRSLAQIKETAAQLAAETKRQVFTPLELDLNAPANVQSALAELVKRGRPVGFLLLNSGMVPGKKRVLTAAGVEAS
jgi:NADP-dependent 3-hydroxy acid dehydrogenase YdfG